VRVFEFDLAANGCNVPFSGPLQLRAGVSYILRNYQTSDQGRCPLSCDNSSNLPKLRGGREIG
jgi:hypothetical protein